MGKLSAAKVRSTLQPGRYSDGEGLYLLVGESGSRRWELRSQRNGRRRDIGLGPLTSVSLADARAAAAELRRKIAQGIDPVAERKQEKLIIPTFRSAARLVHEERKGAWKNGKHQAQWLTTLETYAFPRIGDRLVNDIEGPIIRDILAPIWLSKPETARRVRQRIGTVLDWAYARGLRATEAPMRSLSKGLPRQPKKDTHFAALPYADVPALVASLGERSSVGRLALEALILTAARSGEIRLAVWKEFDLEARTWSIPADRMKMGRAHIVPLSAAALDVLARAQEHRSRASDLVFPGLKPKRPLSDMTLLKILRDMNSGVTVHGFRSAFRDWVAEQTDFPGEVAEAALAHAIPNKAEAAYRRTDFLSKRRIMMDTWGAFVTGGAAAAEQRGSTA